MNAPLTGLILLLCCTQANARLDAKASIRIDSCLRNILIESKSIDPKKRAVIVKNADIIKSLLTLPPAEKRPRCFTCIDSSRLLELVTRIQKEDVFETKILPLRRATSTSKFEMAQALKLITLFGMPSERREAAQILLPLCVDPENIDLLYDIFWTSDDQKFINAIVDGVNPGQGSTLPATGR